MKQKPKLTIVKIGGKLLESEQLLAVTLQHFTHLQGAKMLVHGGGKAADQWCTALGISPIMKDGRRITDAATLEVVTMVYAGLENKKVVSQLQALGCDAIGLSGADANSILAHKRPVGVIDFGFAGDIDFVNAPRLKTLLEIGLSPVFCAITHDGQGLLLNTNADTIAAEMAKALTEYFEVRLFYCFEKAGVLADPADEQSVIPQLDQFAYQSGKKAGTIAAGMLPKLDNAFAALNAGVYSVNIGNPASLATAGGTNLALNTRTA
ncbi:MAG: acetylglutamate kinase [Saprospiraceae bacterium]|nr:MAG: acetylglutamate kinase [Saprospiraceae bacterium]